MYEALSSTTLERQFGPIEVEVMFQDEATRIICTKAVGDGRVLEVSRVVFAPDAAASWPEPYQDMLAGESMGKAFAKRGIEFERSVKDVYAYDLPPAFERWFGGSQNARVIDLVALVGPHQTPFAEILETYRPEVKGPYSRGEPTPEQSEQLNLLNDFLETRSRVS